MIYIDCVFESQGDHWYCPVCKKEAMKNRPTPPRRTCTTAETRKLLGDHVEAALKRIGITPSRVEKIIRRKCGCRKRKQLLNRLDAWARNKMMPKS